MLTTEKLTKLQDLTDGLDSHQLAWLSGYLAGLSGMSSEDLKVVSVAPSAETGVRQVTVLYGSQSGNAHSIAEQLAERARVMGLPIRVNAMGEYKRAQLKKEEMLLVIVSTHGEGEPPDDAKALYDFIFGKRAPRLDGVEFAVLALGDSTYEHFCKIGRDFNERLSSLGAARISDIVECDVDFDVDAGKWISSVLERVAEKGETFRVPIHSGIAEPAKWTRSNPFEAEVIENVMLTRGNSDKRAHHLEISLEGSGIVYQPGDSLGVWPVNSPAHAARVVEQLGVELGDEIELDDVKATVQEWLVSRLEISRITTRVLARYAEIAGNGFLSEVAADVNRADLYCNGIDLASLLEEYPPGTGSAAEILSVLRRMAPRLYSISSSHNAREGEAHLLVGVDRFLVNSGTLQEGLCSSWLSNLNPGDRVKVYPHVNTAFRLPADNVPIIMVGPGTGVAPFRAFLEEREERGASGDNWLFFGCRRFDDDYYYQQEWLRYWDKGLLTRLDVAFSRDTLRTKSHVPHKMKDHAAELWSWLERGAYIYVCGDEARMAKDVELAIGEIAESAGGVKGSEFIAHIAAEGRYQRDVY